MITILLTALLLAAPACPLTPPAKVHHGKFDCKPGLVKQKCGKDIRCVPPGSPPCAPPIVVVPPVVVPPPPPPNLPPAPPTVAPPPAMPLGFLLRGAAGATLCKGTPVGLLGLRYRTGAGRGHFGAEVYSLFTNGPVGFQALVYLLAFDYLRWHINAGLMHTLNGHHTAVNDVPRSWDFSAGSGLEIPLGHHLALTADWTWYRPISTPNGFDGGLVNSHSLQQSLLTAGLAAEF